jgi:carboxypeptidase C (cathepsin A)
MNHLDIGPKYHQNISFATYEAGHMVYLPIDQLKKMKSDEAASMDQAGAGSQ